MPRHRAVVTRAHLGTSAILAVVTALVAALLVVTTTLGDTQAAAAQNPSTCPTPVSLVNGGFEQPGVVDFAFVDEANVPGWRTTEPDGKIEIWQSGYNGVPAASGNQFAELNANEASTLYQDVATTPGSTLQWALSHRGRDGVDVMQVLAGPPGGTLTPISDPLADDNTAWGRHTGTYAVPAGQTQTRFAFEAVSSTGGDDSFGNFLDSISFGTDACVVVGKSVVDLSANNPAQVGDTVRYTVTATNNGGSSALGAVASDPLPAGLAYVPGSIAVTSGPAAGSKTDAAGDDQAEYDATSRTVTVRLGDATAAGPGDLDAGAATAFTFDAVVTAVGTVDNTATVGFGSDFSSARATATSPTTSTDVVAGPADLVVTDQVSSPALIGRSVTATVVVSNSGPATATGVHVVHTFPAGLTPTTATGAGADCTVTGQTVTCDLDNLAVNASTTLTLGAVVDAGAVSGTVLHDDVQVSGAGTDPQPGNNASSASVTPLTPAVAEDDSASAAFGRPASVSVLTDDTPTDTATFDPSSLTLLSAGQPVTSIATADGTWTLVGGEATFTPVTGFHGTATAAYRVTDSLGVTATATVTATVYGPPTAVDDAVSTAQGVAVLVSVTAGDSADHTTLDPTSVRLYDPATRLWVTTLTVPEGSWSVDATGVVTFTPRPTFSGPVAPVTYRIADAHGDTATATVTVTVTAAGAPTAVADNPVTPYFTPVALSPTANDGTGAANAVFDPTTVRLLDGGAPVTSLLVPDQGTYVVDTSTGAVTFSPLATFTGPGAPVTYTAATNLGTTVTGTITPTVTPPAPPTAVDDLASVPTGRVATVSPLANDTSGPTGTAFVSGSLQLLDPGTGLASTGFTVPGQGAWSVDPGAGVVTFTPQAGFAGPASPVTYAVGVNTGSSLTGTIRVSVGAPPVARPDVVAGHAGAATVVTPAANDVPGSGGRFVAGLLRLVGAGGTPLTSSTVPGVGTWTVDTTAGTVSFDPADGFVGTATVTYVVTDSFGDTASSTVSVTVPAAPVARPDSASGVTGAPVVLDPIGNDAPAAGGAPLDPASVRLVDPTSGASVTHLAVTGVGAFDVDPTTGRVTFTPVAGFTGSATADYVVADRAGNLARSRMTVQVAAAIAAPSNPPAGFGPVATGLAPAVAVLARTGADVGWLAILGVVLTAAGLVLVSARRRPRRTGVT